MSAMTPIEQAMRHELQRYEAELATAILGQGLMPVPPRFTIHEIQHLLTVIDHLRGGTA